MAVERTGSVDLSCPYILGKYFEVVMEDKLVPIGNDLIKPRYIGAALVQASSTGEFTFDTSQKLPRIGKNRRKVPYIITKNIGLSGTTHVMIDSDIWDGMYVSLMRLTNKDAVITFRDDFAPIAESLVGELAKIYYSK